VDLPAGTYRLGPDDGTLVVRTGRTGAAAKAGHDLLIHVTAWEGTLVVAQESSIALGVDATSLRVQEGTGGMQSLGDDDKANIHTTIDDDVLKRQDISFRSTAMQLTARGFHVDGELTLAGTTRPLAFELFVSEAGRLTGTAVVKQTDFGMKPYSTLFGALKVADDVRVEIDAALPQSR
jgi:polyisoprenoid-binding protein YceI